MCTRCSNGAENILHCLRDCSKSHDIWNSLGASSWSPFFLQDVQQWIMAQISSNHALLFAAAAWSIWRWRNSVALDTNPWSFDFTWRFMCHQYQEYVEFLDPGACFEDVMGPRQFWTPPPRNAVKLNVDGSYNNMTGATGVGGVVRDVDGKWLRSFCSHVQGQDNSMFAELYSLKTGLEFLWSWGYRNVICEVDCGELLTILDDQNMMMFHRFRGILFDIKNLLTRHWNCRLDLISREANSIADWIAKLGAHNTNIVDVILDNPPLEIETLLLRDFIVVV